MEKRVDAAMSGDPTEDIEVLSFINFMQAGMLKILQSTKVPYSDAVIDAWWLK